MPPLRCGSFFRGSNFPSHGSSARFFFDDDGGREAAMAEERPAEERAREDVQKEGEVPRGVLGEPARREGEPTASRRGSAGEPTASARPLRSQEAVPARLLDVCDLRAAAPPLHVLRSSDRGALLLSVSCLLCP